MKTKEAELRKKVRDLLAAAEAEDAEEDRRYGKNRRGDEIPEELRDVKSRLAKIRAARKELEEEAKAQQAGKDMNDDDKDDKHPEQRLPSHRIPTDSDGSPTEPVKHDETRDLRI